jgi:hypothetical protein
VTAEVLFFVQNKWGQFFRSIESPIIGKSTKTQKRQFE